MAKYQAGADALNDLNKTNDSGSSMEFSPFKSGTTYIVKVLGVADLISFYSYGIFKKVNSFVAKNPSVKSAKGYPVENLTPFDKAWKYHADKSKKFNDAHSQEANKYRAKQRFALGFINLDTGEPIIVDLSKNQAKAVHDTIMKYKERLNQFAFELSKTGSGTNTSVSLSLIPLLDDLTEEQRKNFENAPKEFDMSLFDGILYEMDDEEQIEKLHEVGFDVTLIGFEPPKPKADEDEAKPIEGGPGSGPNGEILEEGLPF